MTGNSTPYHLGHIGLFPDTLFTPTYLYHQVPAPELAIEVDANVRLHVQLNANGAAYLRKLAVMLAVAANVAEESVARPGAPAIAVRGGAR